MALLASLVATAFSIDLWMDWRRRPRPHVAAYAAGMTMFAAASWALWTGPAFGWTGPAYRIFFLFGAILNILYLALGSMFLVAGRRAGHIMFIALGAFSAIAVTLTLTVPFAETLPASGIPHDIFPPPSEGFGPRLLAAIGGGLGATILIVLAIISAVRFWNRDRRLVWANVLIVAGTLAASSGGTGLAIGEGAAFALSLLVAVILIWLGYRMASRSRQSSSSTADGVRPET
jgi:hypothetical protein